MSTRYTYEDLSVKPQPNVTVMRHPQDDLLIVYALTSLAREHKQTEKEEWALDLAAEITEQHGLTISDAVCQLK